MPEDVSPGRDEVAEEACSDHGANQAQPIKEKNSSWRCGFPYRFPPLICPFSPRRDDRVVAAEVAAFDVPPAVVVGAVPGEDGLQVPLPEDQDVFDEFGSSGPDDAFGGRRLAGREGAAPLARPFSHDWPLRGDDSHSPAAGDALPSGRA
jgi:hypothetical protein